jgi:curli biogenesis system outer membrane secretion channel CsgG
MFFMVMTEYNKRASCAVLVFLLFSLLKPLGAEQPQGKVSLLKIESGAVVAELLVEDSVWGTTPFTIESAKQGIYPIQLRAEGFNTIIDTIELTATPVIKSYRLQQSIVPKTPTTDSIPQPQKNSLLRSLNRVDALLVAVSEISGNGVDEQACKVLSDRLRIELHGNGLLRVLERTAMETILKEQGFQQSGICNSSECGIEMGRLLGVQYMIIGSIGYVGSVYFMALRIVDVATSEVVFTATEDSPGRIEEVMTSGTKSIAQKLVSAVEQSIFGALSIKTTPTNAEVYLDDSLMGVTPFSHTKLSPGSYALSLSKAGYDTIKRRIELEKSKTTETMFSLTHTKTYNDSVALVEQRLKAQADSIVVAAKKAERKKSVRKKVVRQIILGSIGVGFGGVGLYYNSLVEKEIQKKNEAAEQYRNASQGADFDKAWQTYKTSGSKTDNYLFIRNIMSGCGAAFGTLFCITLFF